MANGTFVTLRSQTGLTIAAAETAPTAGTGGVAVGSEVQDVEVRLDTLTTTGDPTHITLRLYVERHPGIVTVEDDIVVPIPLAEPKPARVYVQRFPRRMWLLVQALTGGTTPNVTAITARLADVTR